MHILFLIHGMGTHDEEWSATVLNNLRGHAERYAWFSDNDIDEQVEFCPLAYDHVYENFLDEWQENAGKIEEIETDDSFDTSDYLGWLSDMGDEERAFYWSHLADVVIYRFIPLYRERIRIELIKELATKIRDYKEKYSDRTIRFSIAAHSLGTAIIHDCLHLMGTTQWDEEIDNVFRPQHFKFHYIFMFANTSRLLQSTIDVYQSIVCPPVNGRDHYFNEYVNVHHAYDPVTFLRRFNPDGWSTDYSDISVNHIRQPNIHSLSHYLDHPEVHIKLLRSLINRWVITGSEMEEAVAAYPDIVPDAIVDNIDIDLLKTELEEFKQSADTVTGVLDFIKQLVAFRKILTEQTGEET